ncbi:hypothetical protein [Sanyastnella coralliicola]|uniref:hypothetical protein n=1 Tax=Sanyastnella coralliicola TaxID=3069118 RepID=UPI0027B90EA5|nr:hypothetical protein [Longitalea sp. SCSIO 12813]
MKKLFAQLIGVLGIGLILLSASSLTVHHFLDDHHGHHHHHHADCDEQDTEEECPVCEYDFAMGLPIQPHSVETLALLEYVEWNAVVPAFEGKEFSSNVFSRGPPVML